MGMVQPVLNKNEISKNFTNILILLVIVFWSDLETLETSNDFFFPFSIHLWDSFNSLKFLIYKIYIFHSPSIWFSIKKKRFDVSNVSSLIFLISLLFTIFYLFVWHHFNIFFFWVTLHLFPFQDSRYSLFIRTRSIHCIVCSSRSVVEAVENPLCFGGRWPPEIRGISSIERRNLRYRWRSAYCSPGYRRILENQHYETDRFSDTFRQWKTSWHCQ